MNESPDAPSVATSLGVLTVCEGAVYNVEASTVAAGAVTYQWTNLNKTGDTQAGTTTPGTHNYSVKAVIGTCESSETPLSVRVVASATVALTSDSPTICEGDNVVFEANATGVSPTEYIWSLSGGLGEIARTTGNTFEYAMPYSATPLKWK